MKTTSQKLIETGYFAQHNIYGLKYIAMLDRTATAIYLIAGDRSKRWA